MNLFMDILWYCPTLNEGSSKQGKARLAYVGWNLDVAIALVCPLELTYVDL